MIALLAAIVLTYGYAGWRWFTAPSDVAPVYAAARAVEGNLNLRRTTAQLSASVQRLITEIASARDDDPSEGESEALDNYEEAIEMLNDSLKLSAAKAEQGPSLDAHDEILAPLHDKYFLPLDDTGNIGADQSLQIIWQKAKESLHAGNAFYSR